MKLSVAQLSQFFGGVVEFTRRLDVGNNMVYEKGQQAHITPSLIWLISTQKIKKDDVMPHFRRLHQITPKEARELAKLAYSSPENINFMCEVSFNGVGEELTVEVHINESYSVVINSNYDVAIAEKLIAKGINPVFSYLAPKNQPDIYYWLANKQFDIYKQIPIREAYGRETWTESDYANPADNAGY